MHTETEVLKQRLEASADYDDKACYATIDTTSVGFIDVKTIDGFFRRTLAKGVEYEDHIALIRRLNLNCDGKLTYNELIKGVVPQEPYSKMLLRARQKLNARRAQYADPKFECKHGPGKYAACKTKENRETVKNLIEDRTARQPAVEALDRNYENVSGVSPIKTRHAVDLLGLKCGVGQFNPIMVENVNKLPETGAGQMSPEERRKRGYAGGASQLKSTTKKRPKTPNVADLDASAHRGSSNGLKFKRNGGSGNKKGTSNGKERASLKKDKLVVTNAAQLTAAYTDVQAFDDFVPYTRWNAVRPDDNLASPAVRPRATYGVEGGESERAGASRRSALQVSGRNESARVSEYMQPQRRSTESQRNRWSGMNSKQSQY